MCATASRMQQEKEAVEPIYSLGPFHVSEYYGCDCNIQDMAGVGTDMGTSIGRSGIGSGSGENSKKQNSSSKEVSASIVNICSFTATIDPDTPDSASTFIDKTKFTNTGATTSSTSTTPKKSTNSGTNTAAKNTATKTTAAMHEQYTFTSSQHHYVAILTNEGDVHVFEFHSSSLSLGFGHNYFPHHQHQYGYHHFNHHNHHNL